MPQLDKVTFYYVTFWFILFIVLFYTVVYLYFFVPVVNQNKVYLRLLLKRVCLLLTQQ
jgi:hypothetical protein